MQNFVEICIVLAKKTVVFCSFLSKNDVVFRQIIFLTSKKMVSKNAVVELSKDDCRKMKLINVE